jgi:hypothetical protein
MKRIYLSILFLALNANFVAQSASNKGSTTKPMRLEKSRKVKTSSDSSFGFGSVIGGIASFCYNHPVVTLGLIGAGLGARYYYSITHKINNILDLLCMDKSSFWAEIDTNAADPNMTIDAIANAVIEKLSDTLNSKYPHQLFMHGKDGIGNIIITGNEFSEENISQKIYNREMNADAAVENIILLPKAESYTDDETQGYIGQVWQYATNFIFTGNFKRKRIGCAIRILTKIYEEEEIGKYIKTLEKLNNAYNNTAEKSTTTTGKKPATPKTKKQVHFVSTPKNKSTKKTGKEETRVEEQEEKGDSWSMIALRLAGCAAVLGIGSAIIHATN